MTAGVDIRVDRTHLPRAIIDRFPKLYQLLSAVDKPVVFNPLTRDLARATPRHNRIFATRFKHASFDAIHIAQMRCVEHSLRSAGANDASIGDKNQAIAKPCGEIEIVQHSNDSTAATRVFA